LLFCLLQIVDKTLPHIFGPESDGRFFNIWGNNSDKQDVISHDAGMSAPEVLHLQGSLSQGAPVSRFMAQMRICPDFNPFSGINPDFAIF
jgi:hypothetical protein